jgi:hypothetical protein
VHHKGAKVLYDATEEFISLNTLVQQFVKRLNELNCYQLYFPVEYPKQLGQDEIIEILDQAKAPE